MTLTSTEMKWYKVHQSEIEAVINDDDAIAKYLKDYYDSYLDAYYNTAGDEFEFELYDEEFFRLVFYIFYKYRGINSFRTASVNEDDGDDIYTALELAFTQNESILNERWVGDFTVAFIIGGSGDPIECAKLIRQGVLGATTYGIQEEVARCFEECPNSYYTF